MVGHASGTVTAALAQSAAVVSSADSDEVTVQASRWSETTGARDASAFATVVEGGSFEGREVDLGRVLDDTVGLQVRTYGGLGDFSTVSIRGSTSEQVEVFLDGIPVNRAAGGGVDLSTLPLELIERVEVYRGTAPARLGSSNLGGAIELTSRSSDGPPGVDGALGFGSFGTARASVHGHDHVGSLGFVGGAAYERTDGDFEFHDDNGTSLNPDDDETVARRNNGYDAVSALARVDLGATPSIDTSLANDFFWKNEGVPGIGNFQSDTASLRTLRDLAYARLAWEPESTTPFLLEERVEGGVQEQAFADVNGEIGTGSQKNRNRTFSVASVTRFEAPRAGPVSPSLLVDLRRELFEPYDELRDPPEGPSSSRDTAQLVAAALTSFLDESLTIDPNLRFTYVGDDRRSSEPLGFTQDHSSIDRRVSGKLGARYAVTPSVELRGNASREFRAPSFAELFGDRGSVVGNPELEPEQGWQADGGLTLRTAELGFVESARLETVGFWRDTDDLILFIQTSQRTARAQNIASSRAYGVEVTASALLPAHFTLTGNATYQRTEDRSPIPSRHGNDLPGQPRVDVFARLEWGAERASIFTEVHYLGSSYLDSANLARISARDIVNVGARYSPTGWMDGSTFAFEARNVTDDQVADVFGYPLPGVSFFGSLTWKWSTHGAADPTTGEP